MAKIINGSPNIATLDSAILVNLATGKIQVDLSPSIFIGGGSANISGASVKVELAGVTIKEYPLTGFDILPPTMSNVIEIDIPTVAGSYQYGLYSISVKVTDPQGITVETELSKSVDICPIQGNKLSKRGILGVSMKAACKKSELSVILNNSPNYNGRTPVSQVTDLTLEYPTKSGLPLLPVPVVNFSVPLYEGVYELSGDVEVVYDMGDNVTFIVLYTVKERKEVRCAFDGACVAERLEQLMYDAEENACGADEIYRLHQLNTQVLLLIQTIEYTMEAGGDVSDLILRLEDKIGCSCACNCGGDALAGGGIPAANVMIEGCGVASVVVGLTTTYTIDNYEYKIAIPANGGALTVSDYVTEQCQKVQIIAFDINKVYAQIKGKVNTLDEYNFWAAAVKAALKGIDAKCLGLTQLQSDAMSLKAFIQKIVDAACKGGQCDSEVKSVSHSASGGNVILVWDMDIGEDIYDVNVYVDLVLYATTLAAKKNIKLIGLADGLPHNYTIVPKCANAVYGVSSIGSFNYYQCPTIAKPVLPVNVFNNVACPYNLTNAVPIIPAGLTLEWHTQNNTNTSTIVPNIASVEGGSYYAFLKNSNGCFSESTTATVICTVISNCTAPQNVTVMKTTSGHLVRFDSASSAPVSGYTVKRRLLSAPDVAGSYTSVGNATWNTNVNKWEVLDPSLVSNTAYVYRAISNCTESSPYIDYTYYNFVCPVITHVSTSNSITATFTPTGGDVAKYTLYLTKVGGGYAGNTERVPMYPATIEHTFGSLPQGQYNLSVKMQIGAVENLCPIVSVATNVEVPPIAIIGTVSFEDNVVTIKDISLSINCDTTFTLNGVMLFEGVNQNFSEQVTVLAGQTGASLSLDSGAVIISVDPLPTYLVNCNGQSYAYDLAVEGGGFELYIAMYGYTTLDTTGEVPTRAQYLQSVTEQIDAENFQTQSVTLGADVTINSFGNTFDKVAFLVVPDTEIFVKWSEIGNPLQQNQPIDQSYGVGSNIWFLIASEGGLNYYITRSQTSFGGPIKFEQ